MEQAAAGAAGAAATAAAKQRGQQQQQQQAAKQAAGVSRIADRVEPVPHEVVPLVSACAASAQGVGGTECRSEVLAPHTTCCVASVLEDGRGSGCLPRGRAGPSWRSAAAVGERVARGCGQQGSVEGPAPAAVQARPADAANTSGACAHLRTRGPRQSGAAAAASACGAVEHHVPITCVCVRAQSLRTSAAGLELFKEEFRAAQRLRSTEGIFIPEVRRGACRTRTHTGTAGARRPH